MELSGILTVWPSRPTDQMYSRRCGRQTFWFHSLSCAQTCESWYYVVIRYQIFAGGHHALWPTRCADLVKQQTWPSCVPPYLHLVAVLFRVSIMSSGFYVMTHNFWGVSALYDTSDISFCQTWLLRLIQRLGCRGSRIMVYHLKLHNIDVSLLLFVVVFSVSLYFSICIYLYISLSLSLSLSLSCFISV